jgi:predicted AAA+ superfamily ATPase
MYQRLINLSKSNSFYLFGARGTGKSTLLKTTFATSQSLYIDLLDPEIAEPLLAHPEKLKQLLEPHIGKKSWVILDEVQKVPALLDLVHQYIERKSFHFALTGSSARKLKRGQANLLAGRAFIFSLYPLTHLELHESFDLEQALQFGSLPAVVGFQDLLDKKRFLKSYATTYLKEEILIEQVIRNLPPFKRFLEIAAATSGELLNYSNIAKDILSDPKTVSGYYTILEDTLLGFFLPAFHQSIRKQQRQAQKFYFFDLGVTRALAQKIDTPVLPKTFEYGLLFENFVMNEIHRLLSYQEKQFSMSYLRTKDDVEIDLIIERTGEPTWLCEIKSADRIDERHTNSLEILGKSLPRAQKLLISLDPVAKKIGSVTALPWRAAIKEILG